MNISVAIIRICNAQTKFASKRKMEIAQPNQIMYENTCIESITRRILLREVLNARFAKSAYIQPVGWFGEIREKPSAQERWVINLEQN